MHTKMGKYKVKSDVCEVATLLFFEQISKSANFDSQESEALLKKINNEIEAYKIVYQVQKEKDRRDQEEEVAREEERRR